MAVKLLGSPKNETDEITYNKNGIEKWALWSEGMMDWVELPLDYLKEKYPKKFEAQEQELIEEELESVRRPWHNWF